MFLARLVPHAHALSFDDDAWVRGLIRFVLAEMVPDMRAVGLHDGRKVVCGIILHGDALPMGQESIMREAQADARGRRR
jgi:hypothetical protein